MTSTQGQAMDFPDSIGYWAFQGHKRVNWSQEPVRCIYEVTKYVEVLDADEAPYPAIVISEDRNSRIWRGKYYPDPPEGIGGLQWVGSWHKIVLPWDTPTPPTAPLSAQSIETLGACCQTAYRKCLESVAYHQQREGGGSVLSSDAVKEMERLEGEMQKITHALAELELAQSPTVGASVPSEPQTIYIVYQTSRYEGWNVDAIFATEADAKARAKIYNDEAWNERCERKKSALGDDYEEDISLRYDEFQVYPDCLYGTLDEWLEAQQRASGDANDGKP